MSSSRHLPPRHGGALSLAFGPAARATKGIRCPPGLALVLLAAPALLLAPQPAQAVEAELSPGDDVAGVTSNLSPGDIFTFNDGLYELDTGLNWSGVGTADQPIILKAAEGATPVLKASAGAAVAYISSSSYIEVVGLTFEGGDDWETSGGYRGVRIDSSDHITLDGVEIRQVPSQALWLNGDCSAIEVYDSHLHHSLADGVYMGCGNGSCATTGAVISFG